MKRVGKLCLCLAGGLALHAGLRAADPVSSGNPYAPIATRNVFDIKPPPLVDPNQAPAEPPPKITPNGITSNLGHLRVLFKVAVPAKPGQPAKDQCYILSEGQAQDDIEVTKINEAAGLVTFNNHGTSQELPLAIATASGPSAPAPSGPGPAGPPRPNFPMPGIAPGGGNGGNAGIIHFGQSGGFGAQKPNISGGLNSGIGGMNGGVNSGSRLGVSLGGGGGFSSQLGAATTGGGYSSPQMQNPLSAQDQAALVTANHAMAVAQGDPTAAIFPPTPYDSEAGVTPNVAPSP